MFKKLVKSVKTLTVATGILAMAGGAAHGATVKKVDLYGASAQYKFWTSAAPEYLQARGCSTGDMYVGKAEDLLTDRDAGISICMGSAAFANLSTGSGTDGSIPGVATDDTVVFTYTTFASFEGINAVKGVSDVDNCVTGDNTTQRKVPEPTDLSGWTAYGTTGVENTLVDTDMACADVEMGASDVKAETFQQSSSGETLGPCDGGAYSSDVYNYTIDKATYEEREPIVVPFAFYVNAVSPHEVPFDNLTRLMATSLFSGQVADWNQFVVPGQAAGDLDGDGTANETAIFKTDGTGGDYLPVTVCLRHAGSGTHATIDAAVMRGDYGLVSAERTSQYSLWYFNKGSSDMMKCVGGKAQGCDDSSCTDGYDGSEVEYCNGYGAVGYADSDKCCGSVDDGVPCDCKDGKVKRVAYMGAKGDRANIVNGVYDFWSAQHVYTLKTDPDFTLADDLMDYASIPSNIPSDRANWWAAQDEMKVEKATDFTFPQFK